MRRQSVIICKCNEHEVSQCFLLTVIISGVVMLEVLVVLVVMAVLTVPMLVVLVKMVVLVVLVKMAVLDVLVVTGSSGLVIMTTTAIKVHTATNPNDTSPVIPTLPHFTKQPASASLSSLS